MRISGFSGLAKRAPGCVHHTRRQVSVAAPVRNLNTLMVRLAIALRVQSNKKRICIKNPTYGFGKLPYIRVLGPLRLGQEPINMNQQESTVSQHDSH